MSKEVKKLEGNTATLGLTNFHSMTIKINDDCETLQYQYNGTEDDTIYQADIEYMEDIEDVTGYAESDPYQPSFKTEEGNVYFLAQFMRDNF